jgi:hypothetical protein
MDGVCSTHRNGEKCTQILIQKSEGNRPITRRRRTRAVCKVRRLTTVRRCYAEGGGDCYTKL